MNKKKTARKVATKKKATRKKARTKTSAKERTTRTTGDALRAITEAVIASQRSEIADLTATVGRFSEKLERLRSRTEWANERILEHNSRVQHLSASRFGRLILKLSGMGLLPVVQD